MCPCCFIIILLWRWFSLFFIKNTSWFCLILLVWSLLNFIILLIINFCNIVIVCLIICKLNLLLTVFAHTLVLHLKLISLIIKIIIFTWSYCCQIRCRYFISLCSYMRRPILVYLSILVFDQLILTLIIMFFWIPWSLYIMKILNLFCIFNLIITLVCLLSLLRCFMSLLVSVIINIFLLELLIEFIFVSSCVFFTILLYWRPLKKHFWIS